MSFEHILIILQTSNDVHSSTAKSDMENRTSIQNTIRPTVIEHNSNTQR